AVAAARAAAPKPPGAAAAALAQSRSGEPSNIKPIAQLFPLLQKASAAAAPRNPRRAPTLPVCMYTRDTAPAETGFCEDLLLLLLQLLLLGTWQQRPAPQEPGAACPLPEATRQFAALGKQQQQHRGL